MLAWRVSGAAASGFLHGVHGGCESDIGVSAAHGEDPDVWGFAALQVCGDSLECS